MAMRCCCCRDAMTRCSPCRTVQKCRPPSCHAERTRHLDRVGPEHRIPRSARNDGGGGAVVEVAGVPWEANDGQRLLRVLAAISLRSMVS